MCPVSTSTPMTCAGGPLSAIDADLLIVPLFQGEGAGAVPDLDAATGGELTRAFAAKEFSAKPYELSFAAVADAKWRGRRGVGGGGGGGRRGGALLRGPAGAGGGAAPPRAGRRAPVPGPGGAPGGPP